jgi:hypothetical protein
MRHRKIKIHLLLVQILIPKVAQRAIAAAAAVDAGVVSQTDKQAQAIQMRTTLKVAMKIQQPMRMEQPIAAVAAAAHQVME